jgi:hypothetical protein
MSEAVRALTPEQIEEDKHWWFASRTWALLGMLDRVVTGHGSSTGPALSPALSLPKGPAEGMT